MYIPSAFQETAQDKLHGFIEANPFGLLISTHDGEPFATHLPFLLERGGGPHGRLVGHMARANPQWRGLDGEQALAVFSGPHAYVSPSWYEAEDVVPTWNYVAVHAYGAFRLVDGPEAVQEIVLASVAAFDRSTPTPWTLDIRTGYFEKMIRGIVGFRIEIERLEGKWKLNQNHPRERREKVVRALEQSTDQGEREIARLMDEMLGGKGR
jgi:transcriptional regulator